MKKVISVVLAILMLSAVLSVGVVADGSPTFKMSSASVKAGKDFEVTIKAENNPGIISTKFTMAFDGDFTLKKVAYGKELGGMTQEPQDNSSPVILNWINNTKEIKGDILYATLTFSASKTAANGDHTIEITYDPEDVYNMQEKNVTFKVTNAVITVSGGTSKPVEAPALNGGNTSSASSAANGTKSSSVAQSSFESKTASSSAAKGTNSTKFGSAASSGEVKAGETSSEGTGAVTTGSAGGHDDGNGDYVGEEVEIDFVDENGSEIVTTGEKTAEKETKPIWVFAVLAALLIVAGAVIAFLKKKTDKGEEEQ